MNQKPSTTQLVENLSGEVEKYLKLEEVDNRLQEKEEMDARLQETSKNNLIRYLLIIVDLTKSMDSNDLKPTRLGLTIFYLQVKQQYSRIFFFFSFKGEFIT